MRADPACARAVPEPEWNKLDSFVDVPLWSAPELNLTECRLSPTLMLVSGLRCDYR